MKNVPDQFLQTEQEKIAHAKQAIIATGIQKRLYIVL